MTTVNDPRALRMGSSRGVGDALRVAGEVPHRRVDLRQRDLHGARP